MESNLSSQNHGRTSMDSGNIVYNFPQNSGIKAEIAGVVSTISFTGINPAISGTNIVFVGDAFKPIYADFGDGIVTVADTSTNVPGGSGTFQDFDSVSISGSAVTFLGRDATGQTGIYTTLGGTLEKIVAEGDTLDGRTVIGLFASREALSGQNIAFAANFEDGFQTIYVATYEPPLEGDYNHDGFVDAADYVVWRKNDGTQPGYDTWRAHFGNPGSGDGSLTNGTVPEPATLALMTAGMLAMFACRREAVS